MTNKVFLIIGQFSLALGIIGFLLNYLYLDHLTTIAFASGIFFGLALVMNMAFILKLKK